MSRFHSGSGRKQVIPVGCDDHLVPDVAEDVEGAPVAGLAQIQADRVLEKTSPGSHGNIHHLNQVPCVEMLEFYSGLPGLPQATVDKHHYVGSVTFPEDPANRCAAYHSGRTFDE